MYRCVECNHETEKILKKLATYNQVLVCHNKKCSKKTDKYYEYNSVMCVIDLLLMKKEIFRHFVYNIKHSNNSVVFRTLLSIIFCKVFYGYGKLKSSGLGYSLVLRILITLFAKVSCSTLLYIFVLNKAFNKSAKYKTLCSAIVISDYYYFLLPFFVIWKYSYEYMIVVEILATISNAVSLTAVMDKHFMVNLRGVVASKLVIMMFELFMCY